MQCSHEDFAVVECMQPRHATHRWPPVTTIFGEEKSTMAHPGSIGSRMGSHGRVTNTCVSVQNQLAPSKRCRCCGCPCILLRPHCVILYLLLVFLLPSFLQLQRCIPAVTSTADCSPMVTCPPSEEKCCQHDNTYTDIQRQALPHTAYRLQRGNRRTTITRSLLRKADQQCATAYSGPLLP